MIESHFSSSQDIGLIVIFDIILTWNDQNKDFKTMMERLTDKQKSSFIIIKEVISLSQLLKELVLLRDPSSSHLQGSLANLPISLIIIDNISAFYWNTKAQGHLVEEYTALGSLLKKTQSVLGCSIITTSWDKQFNVLSSGSEYELSSYYTDIPSAYFHFIDHTYYMTQNRKSNHIKVKYKGKDGERVQEFFDIV